jgi:hyperosmotically inducible protein
MSYLGRPLTTFALAVLIAISAAAGVAASQVSAVKDGWLVMKVHSEFVNEDVLSGSNIDVDVKNGVVTLQGTVPSEAARARALAVAKANDGVKSVVDQLRIAPAVGSNMEAKAEKIGEKTERAGEKAADKTASAAKKTGRAIDDGWIKSKIYTQYLADWNTILDDSDIDIDVKNNHVTLSGFVKSAEAKAKAVKVAKDTDGVKSVKDNLKVSTTTR